MYMMNGVIGTQERALVRQVNEPSGFEGLKVYYIFFNKTKTYKLFYVVSDIFIIKQKSRQIRQHYM